MTADKMKPKNKPPGREVLETPAFQEVIEQLGLFTHAHNTLKELEADLNARNLELITTVRQEYADLQAALTLTEASLERICRAHAEWFEHKKSIKTPFGTVTLRDSTELAIENPELTLHLLRAEEERVELQRDLAQSSGKELPEEFDADQFIRTREELDLESLEKLDDATLKKFRIVRVAKSNFSVKPATVDLGKAVKESLQTETPKAA